MADKVLFEEQPLDGFFHAAVYGWYMQPVSPPPFSIVVGKTYRVKWDGATYECVATDSSSVIAGTAFLGNGSAYGFASNNEPFAVLCSSGDVTFIVTDGSESTEHTIAIYQVTEDETPVGIILRDYKGEETIHYGKERLEVDTTDGGTALYVREDLVEPVEKTVELDFSGGDMTVTPEDGQVFSNVNIPVPAGLIPANIPEGMYIAGIGPGALAASGGGAGKVACGVFTGEDSTTRRVITHELGEKPDFVMIGRIGYGSGATGDYGAIYGFSSGCKTKYGFENGLAVFEQQTSGYKLGYYEAAAGSYDHIYFPNDTEIWFPLDEMPGMLYFWIAVSGLT